ncbi:hypothetical protein V8C35DRAFT_307625 [Trichoderma chlorosporum]
MPRFSVAFARRKSTADDIDNAEVTPPGQSSFRVLERHDYSGVKSFDGGAKMAKSSGALLPKPDYQGDDNMFSDMKANRGSGLSNTTHTTSTDTSSRHSNASTAPSSADFNGGNLFSDDHRNGPPKSSSSDMRGNSNKSIGSKFLDRAGRTFSFGGQKKHTIPPPLEDPLMPDLPPPMPIMAEPGRTGSRGTTTYTQVPTTPAPTIPRKPAPRSTSALDLGSDFGSMFSGSGFEKRGSMATLKNDDLASPRLLTGNPQGQPFPRSPDAATPAEPLLSSWNTPKSNVIVDDYSSDKSASPTYESPPRVPAHSSPRYQSPARQPPPRRSPPAEQPPARQPPPMSPDEAQDDEDAQLLQETYTAIQLLSAEDDEFDENPQQGRYRREEDTFTATPRAKPGPNPNSGKNGDGMRDNNRARFSKPNVRYVPPDGAPRNKVMTPAEFEKYREDKIRHDRTNSTSKDDEDEDINYEDEEDEAEKSKQQAKQRRKQEAHMAVYRQQMMKVTGETNPTNGLGIPSSMSAPQLGHVKTPSLDPAAAPPPMLAPATAVSGASDEPDDDEEIPLAILQAHGFPNKNRPPTRLSTMGSNPNMRASTMLMPGRPSSAMGESAASRRHSTLPAFARNLPQDPFIGASIAQPALRESLSFNDMGMGPKPPSPLPPGGLVGVIANEERQRAMRRGSPSVDPSRLMGSGYNTPVGIDPVAGIPAHMMYPQTPMGGMGGGMPQMMPQMMQPPMASAGDQAQLQMTQQMSQFMQMQMQFMQMMAANQNGGMPQQQQQQLQPPFQQSYGGLMGNQSMVDISSRNSMIGEQTLEPRRADYGSMRTMSMVQPSSAPMAHPGYAGSIRSSIHGYTPSIAPSERSNIGLPNRYRPVSQAIGPTGLGHMQSQSFSGALSSALDSKHQASMRIVNKSSASDDDDDEEGWEAMKNKRDKKRSIWRSKKNLSSVI